MKTRSGPDYFICLPALQGRDPISAALHLKLLELQSTGVLRDYYNQASNTAMESSELRTIDETLQRIEAASYRIGD